MNVIPLHSPLKIVAARDGNGELTFWTGEAFDYEIPFRKILAEMETIVGRHLPAKLSLPPPTKDEDFVEGALLINDEEVRIYYEYSLAHLTLHGRNETLEMIRLQMTPHVQVKVGT